MRNSIKPFDTPCELLGVCVAPPHTSYAALGLRKGRCRGNVRGNVKNMRVDVGGDVGIVRAIVGAML